LIEARKREPGAGWNEKGIEEVGLTIQDRRVWLERERHAVVTRQELSRRDHDVLARETGFTVAVVDTAAAESRGWGDEIECQIADLVKRESDRDPAVERSRDVVRYVDLERVGDASYQS
jgi:hypothetical protein